MWKWFWPGVTWTAALTAVALWFGADDVQGDIGDRSGAALKSQVWAGFDVDGRDVTLKGMAPDPQAQAAALSALRETPGVREVTDLTTVLPLASPYIFTIDKDADGLRLSGSIPDNDARERLTAAAEDSAQGGTMDDEMALARGAPPAFADAAAFAVGLAKDLKQGQISIADGKLALKGEATDAGAYRRLQAALAAPLPAGLQAGASDLAPPAGGS